jgi:hypothetical protein
LGVDDPWGAPNPPIHRHCDLRARTVNMVAATERPRVVMGDAARHSYGLLCHDTTRSVQQAGADAVAR